MWTWLKYEKFQIKSSWVPDNSCRFVAQYFKDTALTLNGGHFTLSTSSGTNRLILLPWYDEHPRHFCKGVPPGILPHNILVTSFAYPRTDITQLSILTVAGKSESCAHDLRPTTSRRTNWNRDLFNWLKRKSIDVAWNGSNASPLHSIISSYCPNNSPLTVGGEKHLEGRASRVSAQNTTPLTTSH